MSREAGKPPAWAMKAAQACLNFMGCIEIDGTDIEELARIIADACPAGKPCKVCGREITIPFESSSDWCTGCGPIREKVTEWERSR